MMKVLPEGRITSMSGGLLGGTSLLNKASIVFKMFKFNEIITNHQKSKVNEAIGVEVEVSLRQEHACQGK